MSCRSVDVEPSATSIDGRATLTFDRSRIVSAATATHTQNARQRCGSLSGIDRVGGGGLAMNSRTFPCTAADRAYSPDRTRHHWTMTSPLPAPPARDPDLADDFSRGPDPALWVTGYLEHWTTPERAAARFARSRDGLILRIDADQPDWRRQEAPLRVSNLQTGSFGGPIGSIRGTHRHRPDALTVRTPVPTKLLWAPRSGRVDITVSASRDPGCMLAAWLVGT